MIAPPIKINVHEKALNAKSKKEFCRLLQLEGSIYLSRLRQANHSYIADILYEQILVYDAESIIVHQDC